MKKQFLMGLAILLFALTFPMQGAFAQTKLKVQAAFPSGSAMYEELVAFADRIDKISGGKLKFETYPAGAIVPALEVLDATSKGLIDACYSAPAYWSGKNKASALFAAAPGGPFGLDLWDYYSWLYEGGGMELWRELLQDHMKRNVVPFHMDVIAPQIFGWFKTPFNNLSEVKGRKCRMGGLTGDVYAGLGMNSVMMPAGEMIPSAERGVIECAELSGYAEDMKYGIHQIFKYVYAPGVAEPNCNLELLINGDVWKKLAPEHQEMIKSATAESILRSQARAIKANAIAVVEAKKAGVHLEKTPDDVLAGVLNAWEKIVQEESSKNPIFKKIIDSQRAFAQMVVPVHRQYFTDYSFLANYYFPAK
jgi:TRAP-type mannitol/chloroaromatic compound transport system substrate-binding protein